MGISQGQQSGVADGGAVYGGYGDGGVVDEPVADHLRHIVVDAGIGGGHGRYLPGQLLLPRKRRTLGMGPYFDLLHLISLSNSWSKA